MIFELQNVSLQFRQNKALFRNLTLRFESPGIFAILGPSGCGKSTLLRILAGLQKVDQGQVRRTPKSRSSFIFQEPQLLAWRTAAENIFLPLELKKQALKQTSSSTASSDPRVLSTLESVGLSTARDLFPHELSGGMKMRVSLARALVTDPEVLFCDEPFAALDEVTREDLQKKLRSHVLKKQGLGFFVTHNLSEALEMADQIFLFKKTQDGNSVELDPTPYFVNRYQEKDNQLQDLRQKVWESFK